MKAIFTLEIKANRLYVFGEIPYLMGEKSAQIVLGKNVNIKKMSINGNCNYRESISPDNDYFRIYSIDEVYEDGHIYIEYDSRVEGENNILCDEIVSLSLYSNTFPLQLPDYIDESTCYFKEGFENYDIIYSYTDENRGLLAKDTRKCFGEIVNIVGFRKGDLKSFEIDNIKVYYRNEQSYENLYECAKLGAEAFSYYNQIYSHKEARMDLIVLGVGNAGAYNRANLIVSGIAPKDFCMPKDMMEGFPLTEEEYRVWLKYSTFTHELGHVWFCHADTNSYEDWLNETGAEWSSLLFLLHKGELELFQKFYSIREHEYKLSKEPIKPKDMHRPNAVHGSGVVLFYKIYEKYSIETVLKILQILSRMEKQCTNELLEKIRMELSAEVADFIQNRLDSCIEI